MEIHVNCRCGRTLRVQPGERGTTIRCWHCHAEHVVRPHRFRGGIRGAWGGGRGLLRSSAASSGIILLAMLVTFALTIPRIGDWIALGLLAAAATFYVRRLEQASRVEEPDAPEGEGGWPRFRRKAIRVLGRIALGAMLALGMAAPFWMIDGSRDVDYEPKPLEGPALFVAALVTWFTLPLAIYLLVSRDAAGRLGPRWALLALRRKPLTAVAALLSFPMTGVVAEALIVLVLWASGWLPLFVADLMPIPEGYEVTNGYLRQEGRFIRPQMEDVLDIYPDGLARGASLSGTIPMSLGRGLLPRVRLGYSGQWRESYLLIRLFLCFSLVAVAMVVLSGQAAVLGSLPRPGPVEPTEREAEPSREELPDGLVGGLHDVV